MIDQRRRFLACVLTTMSASCGTVGVLGAPNGGDQDASHGATNEPASNDHSPPADDEGFGDVAAGSGDASPGDTSAAGDPIAGGDSSETVDPPNSDFCPPLPPPIGPTIAVRNLLELQAAIGNASDGDTIEMAAGTYQSNNTLVISDVGNLTIRGATGDAADVVLRGPGYSNDSCSPEQHGFQVYRSPNLTLADFTIEECRCHGVQVQPGGNTGFRAYRMVVRNTGQQNIKVNAGSIQPYPDNGEVSCSEISFTTGSLAYNNGIDVHGGWYWVIRDNLFQNLRAMGGTGASGPAILMWNGSGYTTVERNTLINCWQGIALGINSTPSPSTNRTPGFQHVGGLIRNNVVVNLSGLDAGIIVGRAKGVAVFHNTVWTPDYWASIESNNSGNVDGDKNLFFNNIATSVVALRSGDSSSTSLINGHLVVSSNGLFRDLGAGDARLASPTSSPVDAAVPLPAGHTVDSDMDGDARPNGSASDAGADEYSPAP